LGTGGVDGRVRGDLPAQRGISQAPLEIQQR
jgi:hypothetical protein